MSDVRYVSGTGSVDVGLEGPVVWVGTATSLRSREWGYALSGHGLRQAARKARECQVGCGSTDPEALDLLRRAGDRDMAAGTPGALWVGEWWQRAYLVKSDVQSVYRSDVSTTLTFVLLDGAWRRGRTARFEPRREEPGGLALPCDLPCDLGAPPEPGSVEAWEWADAPVALVVYGPASDPSVTIGGNRYEVDTYVPPGARLVVDGVAKTIVLVGADGSRSSRFQAGVRAGGEGGGSYCFQRIPAGTSDVTWDGSFGFDLIWCEEEGEPPWSQS